MNSDDQPLSEETVMAYADGQLDASAAARVEAAMAADPAVAAKVRDFRAQREALKKLYGGALTEPVPPQLVATARGLPRIRPRRRWGMPEWGALAASLVLGVALAPVFRNLGPAPLVDAGETGLVASGALAAALDQQLAGDSSGRVRTGVSFQDQDGNYCRSFAVEAGQSLAGLACRGEGEWRIPVLTNLPAGVFVGGEYRLATTALPASVREAIEARIAGEPLDAEGEKAARDRGWQD